jgi:hypothetical protein
MQKTRLFNAQGLGAGIEGALSPFLTRQLFYGMAVSCVVGVGLGLWLEPPRPRMLEPGVMQPVTVQDGSEASGSAAEESAAPVYALSGVESREAASAEATPAALRTAMDPPDSERADGADDPQADSPADAAPDQADGAPNRGLRDDRPAADQDRAQLADEDDELPTWMRRPPSPPRSDAVPGRDADR